MTAPFPRPLKRPVQREHRTGSYATIQRRYGKPIPQDQYRNPLSQHGASRRACRDQETRIWAQILPLVQQDGTRQARCPPRASRTPHWIAGVTRSTSDPFNESPWGETSHAIPHQMVWGYELPQEHLASAQEPSWPPSCTPKPGFPSAHIPDFREITRQPHLTKGRCTKA